MRREKHPDPRLFPQEKRETGPQAPAFPLYRSQQMNEAPAKAVLLRGLLLSIACAGVDHLAQVPQAGRLAGGLQPLLRGVIAHMGRLGAAVPSGHIDTPAALVLHGAHAPAGGAVFQIDLVNGILHRSTSPLRAATAAAMIQGAV